MGGKLLLIFDVAGASLVTIPGAAEPERTDGLWKTTCFELFLKPPNLPSYSEFNFSPSGQWAAYGFEEYRAGVNDLPLRHDPAIRTTIDQDRLLIEAELDLAGVSDGVMQMGLSAVIEEVDGTKSYWALVHGSGEPDFHQPTSFTTELAAAERA